MLKCDSLAFVSAAHIIEYRLNNNDIEDGSTGILANGAAICAISYQTSSKRQCVK